MRVVNFTDMKLGELVKAKRQELGLSLRELAKLTGLSHGYIHNLETGGGSSSGRPMSPTIETLEALAKGLALPYERLERAARGLPELPPSQVPTDEVLRLAEDLMKVEEEKRAAIRALLGL